MKKHSTGKTALSIVRKYHPNVTRVIDAKSNADIEVTAADCKAGKRKGPSSCAMAMAFKRHYDGAVISTSTAYLIKGDTATRYLVPESVSREIVSFDRSKKFEPGEYALKAPTKSSTMSAMRAYRVKHGSTAYRNDPEYKRAHSKDRPRSHKTAGIRSL